MTIPASVTTIRPLAFASNKLTSVTIPAGVTTIDDQAFASNSLQTVFLWGAAPSIDTSSDFYEPFYRNGVITTFYIFPKYLNSYRGADSGWRFYGASVVDAPGGVDFDHNGHGEKPASQMYLTDRNIVGAPAAPSAPGYAFQGWYTQSGQNGVRWDFAQTVVGCVTLYARWKNVFATSGTPLIRGTLQVGSTLQADTGSWAPQPAFHYGWKRDGVDIGGADGSAYTLTVEDLDHTITVTVTASLVGYEDATRTSDPTAKISAAGFGNATSSITGTAVQVGKVLRAETGSWATGAALVYSWRRFGATTPIGTSDTYTPVAADIGKTLTVTVTASRAGYTTVVVPSLPTAPVVVGVFTDAAAPTITGTAQVGTTLTTTLGAWATDATLTYTWTRSGSATVVGRSANYTPVTLDIGKVLTLKVKAARAGFTTFTTLGAVTAAVMGAPFVVSPAPTITGTKKVGSTLTAVTTGWSPSGSTVKFTYVWSRADSSDGLKTPISRATAKTYKVVTADKGKYLTVTVTAKKTGYANTSGTSANDAILIPS